ncbi:MAG: methyltransferase domain-containing protein [Alphaproteobacteria bacterium]|nr:methyltransferase domain-containing protein [Alphaproteobacteria bacterium]
MPSYVCPLCLYKSDRQLEGDKCPGCREPTRTRSLAPLLAGELKPLLDKPPLAGGRLLAFSMVTAERRLLQPLFPDIVSVSLFGSYGPADRHQQGVDIRDLSRYPPASFAAVFGIQIFDYFLEMRRAMDEAYRVLMPGGLLFTMLSPDRLTDDWTPPRVDEEIEADRRYFEYLPPGTRLVSATVGWRWFVDQLGRAGFGARHVVVPDTLTALFSDWFIAGKPLDGTPAPKRSFLLKPIPRPARG